MNEASHMGGGETAVFGTLPDGEPCREARIASGDLAVRVLGFGAILREVMVAGRPVTLGYATLDPYVAGTAYIGAVAGRYANRIAGGRFRLDGRAFQLSRNEGGVHLHGGMRGFSQRNWAIAAHDRRSVTLELTSPDGEEGYPGTVVVRCTYAIEAPGTLVAELEAHTDAPTIVNLALHSYFNLDGSGTVREQLLTVPADSYLPVTAEKIPTGAFAPVAGTPFDFRTSHPVAPNRIDHTFVLRDGSPGLRLAARMESRRSGIRMEVLSTEPGMHVYDGHMLDETKDGFPAYGGICLEPNRFPNSPNEPRFSSPVLRPGETYRQRTEYRFSRGGAA